MAPTLPIASLAVLALAAAGCARLPGPPPGAAPLAGASGALAPGDHLLSLRHGGRTRWLLLHLPPAARAGRPLPLVVVLHSGGGNPALIAERTRFSELADREGFIVAYPAGTGPRPDRFLAWNAGHCCFVARDLGVDDVGFVLALIERLAAALPADRDRVYLAGFSNGGMLAHRIAATAPERLAAVAAVAAAVGGRAAPDEPPWRVPPPRGAVPMLIMHGLADRQVPWRGGRGAKTAFERSDLPLAEAVALWARANGCAGHSVRRVALHVRLERHACTRAPLEVWLVEDGGHAWPGERRAGWRIEYALLDPPTREIDATRVVWDFFRRARRRPPPAAERRETGVGRRGAVRPSGAAIRWGREPLPQVGHGLQVTVYSRPSPVPCPLSPVSRNPPPEPLSHPDRRMRSRSSRFSMRAACAGRRAKMASATRSS